MKLRKETVLVGLSLTLYVASLYFNAIECSFDGQDGPVSGIAILIFGYIGLLVNYNLGWLANITYAISLALLASKKDRLLFIFSIVNVVLALTSLMLLLDPIQQTKFYVGYYLWLSSFVLFMGYAAIRQIRNLS